MRGESGGMHLYNYYANANRPGGCGEELTFAEGGQSIVIVPEQDYTVRVVVAMNDPGVPLPPARAVALVGAVSTLPPLPLSVCLSFQSAARERERERERAQERD